LTTLIASQRAGALFTPKKYQSGEKDVTGGITLAGDELVRPVLYEAANVLLSRITRFSKLKRCRRDGGSGEAVTRPVPVI
jgi:transposase